MAKQHGPSVSPGPLWTEVDLPELPWLVHVVLDLVDGAPQVFGLRLEPRWDEEMPKSDRVITPERLRAFPFTQIKRSAEAAERFDLPELSRLMTTRFPREPGKPWPLEHFEQVARVYERAVANGQPPLPAIQGLWSVSRPSAAKYVKRARELGLLGYPDRAGVAGTGRKASPLKRQATRRKR